MSLAPRSTRLAPPPRRKLSAESSRTRGAIITRPRFVAIVGLALAIGVLLGSRIPFRVPAIRVAAWRVWIALGLDRRDDRLRNVAPLRADDLIGVSGPAAAEATRNDLRRLIWGADTLPSSRRPDSTWAMRGIGDSLGLPLAADGATALLTRMPGGVSSEVAWIRARGDADCLMIYHRGHDGDYLLGRDAIRRFLDEGCDVLAFAMPLLGRNAVDTASLRTNGRGAAVTVTNHELLPLLDAPEYSLLRYFVEPVVASLNQVLGDHHYERVGMTGLSGGGWTTTLYAALDPRILRSYPVAGSEPLFARPRTAASFADPEEMYPPLLRIAGYEALYVLGTSDGRRQMQVVNRYDPCCFSGTAYRLYEPAVAVTAATLNGKFRVVVDENTFVHEISNATLDSIVSDFATR